MKFSTLIAIVFLTACSTSSKINSTNSSESYSIFLVRHAEKADDGTKDPPLTEEGEMRAIKLADLLKNKNIGKIYSTDFKRTRNTAAPLSKLLGIETTIYNPKDTSFYSVLRKELMDMSILVVGHSNSTPTLTNHILGDNKYAKLDESVYDRLFEVSLKDGKYVGEVGSMEEGK